MPHPPSLECPNCGRNLVQGEMHCYFCEFDIEKVKKRNAQGHDNPRDSNSGHERHEKHKNPEKRSFFSWVISRFGTKKP